jgi:hypothetical protein
MSMFGEAIASTSSTLQLDGRGALTSADVSKITNALQGLETLLSSYDIATMTKLPADSIYVYYSGGPKGTPYPDQAKLAEDFVAKLNGKAGTIGKTQWGNVEIPKLMGNGALDSYVQTLNTLFTGLTYSGAPITKYTIAARVGRVLFNPPSRREQRVKENPPGAGEDERAAGVVRHTW